MVRVDGGTPACGQRVVRLLLGLRHVAPCNAMVLEAEMSSLASGVQVRKQIVERRIPAQVAIELPVVWMAGVADDRTPHLLARLQVAREDGDSVRTTHGRIDAVTRS